MTTLQEYIDAFEDARTNSTTINDMSGNPHHWSVVQGIKAVVALAARSGWRPIETAPKDGTAILLYCDDHVSAEFGSVIGFWSEDDGGDWYASEAHSSPLFWASDRPTHWQPLPEPPK